MAREPAAMEGKEENKQCMLRQKDHQQSKKDAAGVKPPSDQQSAPTPVQGESDERSIRRDQPRMQQDRDSHNPYGRISSDFIKFRPNEDTFAFGDHYSYYQILTTTNVQKRPLCSRVSADYLFRLYLGSDDSN